jgi:hypothetical protein
MSGDIFPDDSAGDGRGGSEKKAKRIKKTDVLSFLLFLPFLLPPGFHH